MEKVDWLEPLKFNRIIFRFVGLWPSNYEYTFGFYKVYAIISVGLFIFGHVVLNGVQIWVVSSSDLIILIPTIFIEVTQTLAFVKACFFVINLKRIKFLMACLEGEFFQPQSVEQRKKIEPDLNLWRRTQKSFFVMVFLTLSIFMLAPILSGTTKHFKLPFPAWYPYNVKKSPYYEITYFYQIVAYICRSATTVGIDTFVAGLNTYIGTQCTILTDTLQNLKYGENAHETLKRCILHHKEILCFTQNTNTFFNWIVLCQFFSSLVVIALSMFALSLVQSFSSESQALLLYFVVVNSEIFLYCWFGNDVEIKSSQIPYAAFESDWTGIPISAKKNLLIFIMRAQKPIKMSAINLFSLSLATFTTILRTSWSYFAVLRQVNAQE